MFNDTANPSLYWASTNSAGPQASALSYIPENVWNESGPGGLWSSGGGASIIYSKPSWQSGTGVPADGKRDVPDVALTAAAHDGYLIYQNGALYVVAGTSAASPSFAGMMALVVQAAAARQGNANTALYTLANKQRSGGAAVFHDITSGNNTVAGVIGYSAGVGYDLTTGNGSVDADVLVTHWADATAVPPLHVIAAANALTLTVGKSATLNYAVSGGPGSKISLAVSGLPAGFTSGLLPASFASASGGTTTLTLTSSSSVTPGNYAVVVTASCAGSTSTAPVTLTVTPAPTFTLSSSVASAIVPAGGSSSATLTVAPNSAFSGTVSFQVTGMPSGMTAQFSPATIAAPGSGTTKLTLAATSKVAGGAYPLTIGASGVGLTKTTAITANVPGFTLTASTGALSVASGGKGTILTTHALPGFSSAVTLSVSGLPAGVTASFSPQSVAAPGNGSSTLTLTRGSTAKTGAAALTLTATGGGLTHTLALTLNLTTSLTVK